ncbi:hypothetical protein M409DRAFT_53699 [Zasmidium cellare ATCC 36951]|uniref:Uncharacterized protein n=1 Tax=Zasmidium cellare ATCC 36951 TaxID=1080233 RepID=A0A6A6CKQ0_ZASCE|nr:uncharacterized protein M409DRAFT_53699 [Zasmidium cellare ATCC 36951]KAF2167725.1 hypothetical protein M409DRAFT_53699 [Zasmidium cellare ATCC 36951]
MAQALLWVQDTASTYEASRTSGRRQEARVRRHVQENRRKPVAGSNESKGLEDDQASRVQPLKGVDGVPASALRPNRSLGRLALRPAGTPSTRKQKTTLTRSKEKSLDAGKAVPAGLNVALTKSLPWCLTGLSSSERRSLAFFQLRTSREWSGWDDSHFWKILTLQASQQSQAVARSLIAVSALHERMEVVGSVERFRLQYLSCEQSSKATLQLLAKSELSYFEALVSCLIMICFHGLQRNPASAFVLLRSGTRLLDESNSPGNATPEERQIIDRQLRPLFSRLISRHCGMGDPCGTFAISAERHRVKGLQVAEEKPVVTPVFSTLSEARHWLQLILNWAHDDMPSRSSPSSSQESFLAVFRRLRDTWKASLLRSDFSQTTDSSRSLKLLKAAGIINTIIIEMAQCSNEVAYDQYLSGFEETIALVEEAKLSGHCFGIDAGLLDIVAFVGTKCRDPQIRRRALKLLKSQARLEGDRIASNPATILETLISLEERDLNVTSCHDVPESSRRHLVSGQQHLAHGRIDLFYVSVDGSTKERCSVTMAGVTGRKPSGKCDAEASIPDAVFGAGHASYLENRQTRSYFNLELDRFYFFIPKM